MRTTVDLPPEQVSALADFCKSLGISRAEAVRRALAQMLARSGGSSARERAFGAWGRKAGRTTDFIREIRDEWS